jgi:hypothetical protein
MAIMRDELPNTQVVILSLSSPDLADGLMRGKIASPKNDSVGLIEKRPSGVPSVDGCHTIYSPPLSSALSSAESIAFAA